MIYTVTRTVTIVERWYNVEAASPDEAAALLDDGQITRPPDKEDGFGEMIDAEPDDRGLGTYTLVGEFSEPERAQIARLFSTAVPAAEHAGWTNATRRRHIAKSHRRAATQWLATICHSGIG
jgi:hypothetical protein